jgi:tRNA pseudouridine55 synthase
MARTSLPLRPVDGVLLVDKPAARSSNDTLQAVRRLFGARKAGHAGTLDPLATGLLTVAFGEATKLLGFALADEKSYEATIRLGITTDTGDITGKVVSRHPVDCQESQLVGVLQSFLGESLQIPPMYSALKFKGKALYRYARAGIEVPRESRRIYIPEIRFLGRAANDVRIMVQCSKGTYIRVLAEDIGRALGCGAAIVALRRIGIGACTIRDAVTVDCIETLSPEARLRMLRPPDVLVSGLRRVHLDGDTAARFRNGRSVQWAGTTVNPGRQSDSVAVFFHDTLIGIGRLAEGTVEPARVLVPSTLAGTDGPVGGVQTAP